MNRNILILWMCLACSIGCNQDAVKPSAKGDSSTGNSVKPLAKGDSSTGNVELSADKISFGEKWRSASKQSRRSMVALQRLSKMFAGEEKATIIKVLGKPDESGIDRFGMDVLKYDLGKSNPNDLFAQHVTFVFQDGKMTSVLSNVISD